MVAIAPRWLHAWFFINKRLFDGTLIYDEHLNEKCSLKSVFSRVSAAPPQTPLGEFTMLPKPPSRLGTGEPHRRSDAIVFLINTCLLNETSMYDTHLKDRHSVKAWHYRKQRSEASPRNSVFENTYFTFFSYFKKRDFLGFFWNDVSKSRKKSLAKAFETNHLVGLWR